MQQTQIMLLVKLQNLFQYQIGKYIYQIYHPFVTGQIIKLSVPAVSNRQIDVATIDDQAILQVIFQYHMTQMILQSIYLSLRKVKTILDYQQLRLVVKVRDYSLNLMLALLQV